MTPTAWPVPLLFTTTTTPGLAMDGIFYWTGRGLNWDMPMVITRALLTPCQTSCVPDANGYNTGTSAAANQLLRVVPGPQQAAAGRSLRRCRGWRSGNLAGSEHPDQRRLVRRQSLPRSRRDHPGDGMHERRSPSDEFAELRRHRIYSTFGHYREPARSRGRLRLHVALAQRARDHDQQYFPGRNDDDDAGRFPGIRHRRVELTEEKSENAIQLSQNFEDSGPGDICSPPRSQRLVCPAAVNLTAGPTSVTLPDGSVGADVGLQLRRCRSRLDRDLRALNPASVATNVWSPVVITVPTGQDLVINLTNTLAIPITNPSTRARSITFPRR